MTKHSKKRRHAQVERLMPTIKQQRKRPARYTQINLQLAEQIAEITLPKQRIKHAVAAALGAAGFNSPAKLTLCFVDETSSQRFNRQYRHKDKPTNVLSFASDECLQTANTGATYLGDLIICLPIVHIEAATQHKTFIHHLLHLVVHGSLHLLGFDHESSEADASEMEHLEKTALAVVGVANPYD